MRRTRRADAPDTELTENAAVEPASETPAAPKTTRRSRAAKSADTPTPAPDTETPVSQAAPATDDTEKPKARRAPRRRNAPADAAPEASQTEPTPAPAPIAAETTEAAATEAKPASRRRRSSPKAEAQPAPEATSIAAPPAEDTAEVPEVPTPRPSGRRRGRKMSAQTVAPEASTEQLSLGGDTNDGFNDTVSQSAVSPSQDIVTPAEPQDTTGSEASQQRRRSRRNRGGTAPAQPRGAASDTRTAPDTEITEQDGAALAPVEPTSTRSGRRSRRRERNQPAQLTTEEAIAIAGLTSYVTPVTPATDDVAPSSGRKGRSRRRRDLSDTAPASVEDTVAPVETDQDTSEGGRKSRKRRSRRNRSGSDDNIEIAESADLLVVGEPTRVEEIEVEEDIDLSVLTPVSIPVYVAPPLAPPVYRPEGVGRVPRTRAKVAAVGASGHRRIELDDVPYSPFLFFVNTETASDGDVVEAQIREAAANGVHLFSAVMYLPLKNVYGERPFGRVDALLGQILAADPDAYVLPRLQLVPTNYWVRTHPDQLARYASGEEGDVSMASREFWSDAVEAIEALIEHFSDPATVGGDRVVGFHIDRGEWFHDSTSGYDFSEPNTVAFRNWLRAKYQFDYLLRAAWYDGKVTFDSAEVPVWPGANVVTKKTDTPLLNGPRDGRWVDYARFSSDIVADAITGVAAAVKALSARRMLVAVSYGYTLEFATRNESGHLALSRLLESSDIDIIAGPNSYASRGAGNTSAFGAPLDSVALHNKLWIMEDDTKTYLAGEETPDTYNPKIASGIETQATHERHFGAALAHRCGIAWMDLWGHGWLNNPAIWETLGAMSNMAARWAEFCAVRNEATLEEPSGSPRIIARLDQGLDPDNFIEETGTAIEEDDPSPAADAPATEESATADGQGAEHGESVQESEPDVAQDAEPTPSETDASEPAETPDEIADVSIETSETPAEDVSSEVSGETGIADTSDAVTENAGPIAEDEDLAGIGDASGDALPYSEEEVDFAPVATDTIAEEMAVAGFTAELPVYMYEDDVDEDEDLVAAATELSRLDSDELALPILESDYVVETSVSDRATSDMTPTAVAGDDVFLSADEETKEEEIALDLGWCGTCPDVVVFVDEASLFYLKNDLAGLGQNLIGRSREMLLRTGASIGFFLQSDILHKDLPEAPLYLFLNPLRITSQERAAIREKLQVRGKTVAWLYAPGVFDESGPTAQDVSEVVGITLRRQPWNSRVGSQIVEQRHPMTERVRSGKRIGVEEILNPSFSVDDAQAIVLAEYVSTGLPSMAVREHSAGWKSVFFGDPHLTVELLRGLFQYASVPLYDAQDDVVHASADGIVTIHAGYTGQRVVNLPRAATVYDTLEHRIIAVESRSFRTFLRARTTRLYLFGTAEEIMDFTGLEIPADAPRHTKQEHVQREPDPAPQAIVKPAAEPPAATAPRVIPGLENAEELDDDVEKDVDAPAPSDDDAPPAPRSRWQRRRAAARARREAERKAKEAGQPTQAPVDLTSLLPDLPPRRKPSEETDSPPTSDES
jgi:hypothetical protein